MTATGDIDLVSVPIGNVPPEDWRDLLDDDERRRAAAFRFPRDVHRFINAHLALRTVLGEHLSRPPNSLRIDAGAYGKPCVADAGDLDFNLTHGGDLAAIAVARDSPLGVDLEPWRELSDVDALAASIMTPDELSAFRAESADRHHRALLTLWTRKEACLKAWGLGLQVEPRSVQVGIAPEKDVMVVREGLPALHLRSIAGFDGAALAVASHAPIRRVSRREATVAQLLRSKQKPE